MPESGDTRAPETAAEALSRARLHASRAAGEALAALRALADAASLGWTGRPSDAHAAVRSIAQLLDEQSRRLLEGDAEVPAPVMHAILDALDQEIGRWEKRAERDADARAVLRTFLGLREILWEFGFRRGERPPETAAPKRPARKRARSAGASSQKPPQRRARVQRVDVQS